MWRARFATRGLSVQMRSRQLLRASSSGVNTRATPLDPPGNAAAGYTEVAPSGAPGVSRGAASLLQAGVALEAAASAKQQSAIAEWPLLPREGDGEARARLHSCFRRREPQDCLGDTSVVRTAGAGRALCTKGIVSTSPGRTIPLPTIQPQAGELLPSLPANAALASRDWRGGEASKSDRVLVAEDPRPGR